ncbi:MAG: GlsB/YeaQ/YmgE family stress response membrane protein [Gaiella sp.]
MGIIGWILLGLIAGFIARALVSGDERIGVILTTILGVAGALLGGLVATALGFGDPIDEFFDLSTWLAAIIGAVGLLLVWRAVAARR